MEHHRFTKDGINTLLKLQDKTTDSTFTRDPMAEVPRLRKSKNMVGDACVGLRWKICPVDEDWEPFIYELWIKAHSVFCSSLVQLTWLPNNCLGKEKAKENPSVEDWLKFSKTVILSDLGRSPRTTKIQRQIKSNCEHPKQLFSSGTLNPKLENGYFLWRTGISRMEPYSPS